MVCPNDLNGHGSWVMRSETNILILYKGGGSVPVEILLKWEDLSIREDFFSYKINFKISVFFITAELPFS